MLGDKAYSSSAIRAHLRRRGIKATIPQPADQVRHRLRCGSAGGRPPAFDPAASRTGHGPANLATIRAAVIAAIKDAGYLHIPEGRRDHTTPAEALRLHGLDRRT